MNLQEALKLANERGVKFRRAPRRGILTGWYTPHSPAYSFPLEDILADDWEVEPRKNKKTVWIGIDDSKRILSDDYPLRGTVYHNKAQSVGRVHDYGIHSIEIEVEE